MEIPKKKVSIKIMDNINEKELNELTTGLKKIEKFEFFVSIGLQIK
jgi:hypothetical protein